MLGLPKVPQTKSRKPVREVSTTWSEPIALSLSSFHSALPQAITSAPAAAFHYDIDPYPAGGPEHQDLLARPHLAAGRHHPQRRAVGDRQGRGVLEGEAARHGDQARG